MRDGSYNPRFYSPSFEQGKLTICKLYKNSNTNYLSNHNMTRNSFRDLVPYNITRQERLKSALYLKLKKRKIRKTVKGGPFGLFESPVCCKMSKKLKGPYGDQKKISFEFFFKKKRKMIILNSLIVPKYLKGRPFWLFGTLVC